jgi:hypothetical protein
LAVASYLHDVGDIVAVPMQCPTLIVTDPQRIIKVLRCIITTNLNNKIFKLSEEVRYEFIAQIELKTFTFSLKVLVEVWKKYVTESDVPQLLNVLEKLHIVVKIDDGYCFPSLRDPNNEIPKIDSVKRSFSLEYPIQPLMGMLTSILVQIGQRLMKKGTKPTISQNHIQFESSDGLMIHFWYGKRKVQTSMDFCEKIWFELNVRRPEKSSVQNEIIAVRNIKQITDKLLNQSSNLWEIAFCPECNLCHARDLLLENVVVWMKCGHKEWDKVSDGIIIPLEELEKLIEQMESMNNMIPLNDRFESKIIIALKFCKLLSTLDRRTKNLNLLRKKAIEAFSNFTDGLFGLEMSF